MRWLREAMVGSFGVTLRTGGSFTGVAYTLLAAPRRRVDYSCHSGSLYQHFQLGVEKGGCLPEISTLSWVNREGRCLEDLCKEPNRGICHEDLRFVKTCWTPSGPPRRAIHRPPL